jgi:hypothetical protein
MKHPQVKLKLHRLVRWHAEVSSTTCTPLTATRRKFLKNWYKELNWITFNKNTGIASSNI